MKKRTVLPLLGLGIAGCAGTGTEIGRDPSSGNYLSPERAKYVAENATKELKGVAAAKVVGAMNGFSFDLLRELKPGDENACISPISLGSAFAMVYNGAAGDTKSEMAKVLQVKGVPDKDVNTAYKSMSDLMKAADPKVTINIANAIWAKEGATIRPEFLHTNQDFFGAKISNLDFASPKAPETVNEWVKTNTNGKIPSLVEKFSQGTHLYIANAVYFKGLWKEPFEETLTKPGDFKNADGKSVKAQMMSSSEQLKIFSAKEAAGVAIPYGNGRMEMVVVLPKPGTSMADFLKGVNDKSWSAWMTSVGVKQVNLKLPRWKAEYKASLSQPLKDMGMEKAFTPNKADFSMIRTQKDLFISDAVHKTFIEVNEEGTEAAAATGVEMTATAMPQTTDFVVDRPFFYAVRDTQTGAILFLGVVSQLPA